MELSKETLSKLSNLIDDAKKNKTYEFEVRFWGKNKTITEDVFQKIFQKMTFNNLNNGFGFSYIMKNSLDVILNDKNGTGENSSFLRLSLNTSDDIKKYWLNDSLESINYTLLEKEKIDKIDDFNYNIRYSLNNELSSENILEKNRIL